MSAYESTNQLMHANIIITHAATYKESHIVFLGATPERDVHI